MRLTYSTGTDDQEGIMTEMAGFEPSHQANEYSASREKSTFGTEIGTEGRCACSHSQSCPAKESLPDELQVIVQTWPKLNNELKAAVLAIVRSLC